MPMDIHGTLDHQFRDKKKHAQHSGFYLYHIIAAKHTIKGEKHYFPSAVTEIHEY